ncbi:MAG: diguanylate cyclase [Planctomycetota bacterium]
MDDAIASNAPTGALDHSAPATPEPTPQRVPALLSSLEQAASASGLSASEPLEQSRHEVSIAQARLGLGGALFSAIHFKHPHTAAHCCRVALSCSAWAQFAELDAETRDVLELAALLHDIGKIGVPDRVLLKPGRLTAEEKSLVRAQQAAGVQIIAACCGSERLLRAVRHCLDHYDGEPGSLAGQDIPLESRMIAIADAFDAMVTDQVYRPARPRERALAELFEFAGTQFDPALVKQFTELNSKGHESLYRTVASDWLGQMAVRLETLPWQTATNALPEEAPKDCDVSPFDQVLVDSLRDGVVFVDNESRITMWSVGAERLTGIPRDAAVGKAFLPELLGMKNELRRPITESACPLRRSIESGSRLSQKVIIRERPGNDTEIQLTVTPVPGKDGAPLGATLLLEDLQQLASLEQQCDQLNTEVTQDPMTKVANRGEFDRMLALFIESHQQSRLPCSLIMTDIDRFKSINDTFGHQAGDEAIITLAKLLKANCRSGDLVARYGGEEFAVLCADCGTADAARRAEDMRVRLSEIEHDCLGGKQITASFGVTEVQPGDTPETMLRRSDRALLMAKEQGRNQVVQLGNGMTEEAGGKRWWSFLKPRAKNSMSADLISPVPVEIAVEKLRGFVSDQKARIVSIKDNTVRMEVSTSSLHSTSDVRPITFGVEMQLKEIRVTRTSGIGLAAGEYPNSRILVEIRALKNRSRRSAEIANCGRLIMQSIKAYLMAKDAQEELKAEAAAPAEA